MNRGAKIFIFCSLVNSRGKLRDHMQTTLPSSLPKTLKFARENQNRIVVTLRTEFSILSSNWQVIKTTIPSFSYTYLGIIFVLKGKNIS